MILTKILLTIIGAVALLMYLANIGSALMNRERMRRGERAPVAGFETFARWWIFVNLVFIAMILTGALLLWMDKHVAAAVLGGTPVCFLIVVILTSLFFPKLGPSNRG